MSLSIVAETVVAVLLADGWHRVDPNSFGLDSYEFVESEDGYVLHGGGDSGVCATGFSFMSDDLDQQGEQVFIQGPLTAILAVKTSSS
jgi:hypothetical protein